MTGVFLSGPLGHPPLLTAVLGRLPPMVPAWLDGHALRPDGAVASLEPCAGAGVEGLLAAGLDPAERARLDFYMTVLGQAPAAVTVTTVAPAAAAVPAVAYLGSGRGDGGKPPDWSQSGWTRRWADTATAAAADCMRRYGEADPALLARRYPQMLTRAGARLRAASLRAGTESLRHRPRPGDVRTEALRHPYTGYFAVEEHALRHRRFDGAMSAVLDRAVFVSGDAAVVLPYDPVRDRVLVIEQFRAGPLARGDANPWLIETIAGRIDGGETPEAAARREALEEAGLTLGDLLPGPRYYPSPAAKAEYIYSFVGLAELPDGAGGVGGLEAENEDIRSHVIAFDRLMDLVASGEVDNAPLALLAYWLAQERPRLRGGRPGAG